MDPSLLQAELLVIALAIAVLVLDMILPRISSRQLGLGAAAVLAAFLAWNLFAGSGLPSESARLTTAHGCFVLDALAVWAKRFSMFATLLAILMSIRFQSRTEERLPEFIAIQLFACVGMMLLASATDLISLFVSLELMTVCFYVLVSFRRADALGLEAGLKYLIYGALSSGILLYGCALIYGASGEFRFLRLAEYAARHPDSILLGLGVLLVWVGIAFKISAAPFHWWTPDVYEGAPTPVAALLSIGSKGAGIVLLLRLVSEAFPALDKIWVPLVVLGSGASILYGNLAALSQSNLKRLMGYSSISHSGYMLLGVATASISGHSAVLYYLFGYLLASALVFAVMCETAAENPRQDIRTYAGLGLRSGWTAGALVLGLLSLAGIPPLAGFFGKLLVFQSALVHGHLLILLGIALLGVVCSLYYYLGILRTVYFSDPFPGPDHPLQSSSIRWIYAVLIFLVILVGSYPSPWWKASELAIRLLRP